VVELSDFEGIVLITSKELVSTTIITNFVFVQFNPTQTGAWPPTLLLHLYSCPTFLLAGIIREEEEKKKRTYAFFFLSSCCPPHIQGEVHKEHNIVK
jgi:hypothetical protein